jgi:hypothetical protein
VLDLVGYGAAHGSEGSPAAASPTNAITRDGSGCVDANDDAAGFAAVMPNRRSTASAAVHAVHVPGAWVWGERGDRRRTTTMPIRPAARSSTDAHISVCFAADAVPRMRATHGNDAG